MSTFAYTPTGFRIPDTLVHNGVEYISVTRAAEITKASKATITANIRRGRLKAFRPVEGPRAPFFLLEEQVTEWAAGLRHSVRRDKETA